MRKWHLLGAKAIATVMLFAHGVLAGDLTPPGPPEKTMKSLQEIYDKLEDIEAQFESEYIRVQKTGQTISYLPGDDGHYQKGYEPPNPRFTEHDDGTVTDNLTGLMWVYSPTQLDNIEQMTWGDAIIFCNNLDFAGYSDWRLPNVRELHSLIHFDRSWHALPNGHPPVWAYFYCWSSTTYADDTTKAWLIALGDGDTDNADKVDEHSVWPVRSGP